MIPNAFFSMANKAGLVNSTVFTVNMKLYLGVKISAHKNIKNKSQ